MWQDDLETSWLQNITRNVPILILILLSSDADGVSRN